MDAVIPWERLLTPIESRYPTAGAGRQPRPMERMLYIHFMQNWFNLSAPQADDPHHNPPTTNYAAGVRHPKMHETTKSKNWHLDMKAHVETTRRGIVRSLSTTAANALDGTRISKLLRAQEHDGFVDQAY